MCLYQSQITNMKSATYKKRVVLISVAFWIAFFLMGDSKIFAEGVLENIPDQTVPALSNVSFYATTTTDQFVFFSLAPTAPTGASINVETGLFDWTPSETQAPGLYSITVIAQDYSNDALTEVGTSTFNITVTTIPQPDYDAPTTQILNPISDAIINGYSITISGSTTDDNIVASTTLAFAPYTTLGQGDVYEFYGCGQFNEIISLNNPQTSANFNWSYDWTPPEDGLYCLKAYSIDPSGNDEREADRSQIVVSNISFTKKVAPTPTPTPPILNTSGGRHRNIGGLVLGASTEATTTLSSLPEPQKMVPEPKKVEIVWQTNIPATSQVIYGLTAGGPYTLNLKLKNFGYPLATIQDKTKVINHKVSLPNILVGQSYSLRVVSFSTNPTFGPEYQFILNADGTVTTQGRQGGEIIIKNADEKTLDEIIKANEIKLEDLDNADQNQTAATGNANIWQKILLWFKK